MKNKIGQIENFPFNLCDQLLCSRYFMLYKNLPDEYSYNISCSKQIIDVEQLQLKLKNLFEDDIIFYYSTYFYTNDKTPTTVTSFTFYTQQQIAGIVSSNEVEILYNKDMEGSWKKDCSIKTLHNLINECVY